MNDEDLCLKSLEPYEPSFFDKINIVSIIENKIRLKRNAKEFDREYERWVNSPEGVESKRKLKRSIRDIYNEEFLSQNKNINKFTKDEWDTFVIRNSKHSYDSIVISAAIHMVQFEDACAHDLLCEDFPGMSGSQAEFAKHVAIRLLDTNIIEPFFDDEDDDENNEEDDQHVL